jgi:peroxiredoxin
VDVKKNKTLEIGDWMPAYEGTSHTGDKCGSDVDVGHPTVLVFERATPPAASDSLLRELRNGWDNFKAVAARIVVISRRSREDNLAVATRAGGIPFVLLSDPNGVAAVAFGLSNVSTGPGFSTVLSDGNRRVVRLYDVPADDAATHVERVLADLRLLVEPPQDFVGHAPVLLIPNVLPPKVCQRLIGLWEQQNEDSGSMVMRDGKTVEVFNYNHKIRRDHFLRSGSDDDKLVMRYISGRVMPEVWKAFNYKITRREDFRIACYDAARGGYFRPHRDNTTTGTAHRRFAMSLLLNDGYEGGYLRFPEYARHRYRPAAGGAVIFSCSLLHEATDITAGRRFVLLSFLYGEAEAQQRQQYAEQIGGDYRA